MAKKTKPPTFDEILATLRQYKFDVQTPDPVAKEGRRLPGAMQVSKYGCAALLAAGTDAPTVMVQKPGLVMNGEIALLLDRGYQKFIKTQAGERAARAEDLRSLHKFTEELRQATGGISLYNESLGTVSDEYMYDRVKGRNLPESKRPTPAWELPVEPGMPGEVSSK